MRICKALLLSACVFLVLSCEGGRGNRPIVIKAASVCPSSNPIVLTFQFIKKEIEKRSQGRIRVEIYDSGQLGGETDNVERIRLNTLEMADVSTAVLVPLLLTVDGLLSVDLPRLKS